MKNSGALFLFLLVLAAAITLACGSSPSPDRLLQSVTVAPATAAAQDYPNGQVQFTATGFYSGEAYARNPTDNFLGCVLSRGHDDGSLD